MPFSVLHCRQDSVDVESGITLDEYIQPKHSSKDAAEYLVDEAY